MTATSDAGTGQPGRQPLAPGASPSRIRAALLAEDRGAFDTAYGAALDAARESLDLTVLFETLERDNFARVARRAAELRTGEPVPAGEPLSVTRAKAGL